MSRKPKTTFVGPITGQKAPNGRAGATFSIVQAGGSLKLEYGSRGEGHTARRQLLLDPNTHSVPSNNLLQAIQGALQDAAHDIPPTETEVGDSDTE